MSDVTLEIDVLLKNSQKFDELQGKLRETLDLVTKGAKQFLELAAAGDQYADVMGALKVNVDQARDALHGQIDTMTLALGANRASQAGLELTSEQFRALSVRAKEFADANAMEFEPALQKLVGAIVRGKDRFHEFGIEGEGTAAMLADLTSKSGDAESAIGGVTDATDALSAQWTDLMNKAGASMDGNGALTRMITGLSEMVGWLSSGTRAADGFGWVISDVLLGAASALSHLMDMADDFRNHIGNQDWRGDGDLSMPDVGEWNQGDVDRATNEAASGFAPLAPYSGAPMTGRPNRRPDRLRRRRGGGGGGGGERSATLGAPETGTELGESLGAINRDSSEDALPFGGGGDSAFNATLQRYAKVHKVEQRYTRDVKQFALDRQRARMAELDGIGAYASGIGGALESVGKAFGVSQGTILWLNAFRAATEAVIEWARAAVPYEGAAHVPGAIALSAAAVAAFADAAQLGAKGPSPSAGSGGGGSVGSPASSIGGNYGSGGAGRSTSIVINMGPGLSSSQDVRRAVVQALVTEADKGHPLPYRVVQQRR